jgi:hypothetical protein
MASFPTLPHQLGSKRTTDGGYITDRAQDGTARIRRLYPSAKMSFSLDLGPLDATHVSDLQAHYAADKDNTFSYTWPEDNSSYTCRYSSAIDLAAGEAFGYLYAKLTLEAS